MAWFKIDDNFYDHPKVDELSMAAIGLWTVCGTYSARHLTDGYVPERRVTRLGGDSALAGELVAADLWDEVDGGYNFRNWSEYQPTKSDVEEQREAARLRKQKQRRGKGGTFKKSHDSHTVTGAGQSRDGHGMSQNVTTGNEKQPLDAENTGKGEAPTLSGVEPEIILIDEADPQNHAEANPLSQDGHTVTDAGLTEMSRAESHRPRPDPTRPDLLTLSSHVASDDAGRNEPKPEPVFSDDVHALAKHLAAWIVRNGNRKPNITKTWLQAIDRLIRIDEYTPEQIRQVIDWSQQNEFWQGNILSAPKLRKQFDQLKNRMFQNRNRNTTMAPGSERALNTLQLGQQLLENQQTGNALK